MMCRFEDDKVYIVTAIYWGCEEEVEVKQLDWLYFDKENAQNSRSRYIYYTAALFDSSLSFMYNHQIFADSVLDTIGYDPDSSNTGSVHSCSLMSASWIRYYEDENYFNYVSQSATNSGEMKTVYLDVFQNIYYEEK